MTRLALNRLAIAASGILLPTAAFAHPSIEHAAGFTHGFAHPWTGLDHVLAMVLVGMFAWQLGGRALWLVPAAFVTLMMAGGLLGATGVALPFVETGIALSIVVLGGAVACGMRVSTALAMAVVGLFAIFHGHAHGAEMPADASGLAYGLGFVIATALLHVGGIALGAGIAKLGERTGSGLVRAAGGAAAAVGMLMLVGVA